MRVLFLVRRAGPYHDARYEAAGKLIELSVVETRPDTKEYPWTTVACARNYKIGPLGSVVHPEIGMRGPELDHAVESAIRLASPDVVACTGWADPEYHSALRRCHRRGIPVVVMSDSTRDDEPRTWWKEKIKGAVVRGFSAAVVAGSRSRSYLQSLGFDSDAIFEPCDVVDNEHFSRDSGAAPTSRPYFLCVSRYLPKKNLFLLVEAYAAYRSLHGVDSWDMTILGSGELGVELAQAISDRGLGDHVHRPGFVQYQGLPQYYNNAGACVLPSLSDQWGLAVNEAMASGLPAIVSSACGCAPDLVVEGVTGFTFTPTDSSALAGLLHRVATLPDGQRRDISLACRARVGLYTPGHFAHALQDAASFALAHRRRPSMATRLALGMAALRR